MAGQTAALIMKDLLLATGWLTDTESSLFNILTGQAIWVVLTVIIIFPSSLKKEVNEMHIVAVALFAAVCFFVFMLTVQFCYVGTNTFALGQDTEG